VRIITNQLPTKYTAIPEIINSTAYIIECKDQELLWWWERLLILWAAAVARTPIFNLRGKCYHLLFISGNKLWLMIPLFLKQPILALPSQNWWLHCPTWWNVWRHWGWGLRRLDNPISYGNLHQRTRLSRHWTQPRLWIQPIPESLVTSTPFLKDFRNSLPETERRLFLSECPSKIDRN
jgi:hypothetical protein